MENYANIREILGSHIGRRIIDITQHDENEWAETRQSYVMLMLENGQFLKFPIGDDGFEHGDGDEPSPEAG